MSTRILTLTGTPHPQAEVTACDAEHGILTFRWLDANGQPVDSGGSVARFAPPAPLPQAEDYTGPTQYPEVDDAILVAAIENPPVEPVPVPAVISRAEFIIAVRRVLNITEGDIFALISQLPAGETQETARDLFEHAREFRRSNSFMTALAQLNGNTSEQLDEVFRVGAALDLD